MANLVLRVAAGAPPTPPGTYVTKNAALSYLEIDNNFINLDTEIHQNRADIDILINKSVTVSPTAPATPITGALWFNNLTNTLFCWDGTNWQDTGQTTPTGPNAPPGGATQGDTWYDTANNLMMYYDGTNWQPMGGGYIDSLLDVDTSSVAAKEWDLLRWDPDAVDADGRTGQWVPTNVIDGSPDGGLTDDF